MKDVRKTAVQEAIEYGIDLSLVHENLKLSPTERLRKLESFSRFYDVLRKAGSLRRSSTSKRANRKNS